MSIKKRGFDRDDLNEPGLHNKKRKNSQDAPVLEKQNPISKKRLRAMRPVVRAKGDIPTAIAIPVMNVEATLIDVAEQNFDEKSEAIPAGEGGSTNITFHNIPSAPPAPIDPNEAIRDDLNQLRQMDALKQYALVDYLKRNFFENTVLTKRQLEYLLRESIDGTTLFMRLLQDKTLENVALHLYHMLPFSEQASALLHVNQPGSNLFTLTREGVQELLFNLLKKHTPETQAVFYRQLHDLYTNDLYTDEYNKLTPFSQCDLSLFALNAVANKWKDTDLASATSIAEFSGTLRRLVDEAQGLPDESIIQKDALGFRWNMMIQQMPEKLHELGDKVQNELKWPFLSSPMQPLEPISASILDAQNKVALATLRQVIHAASPIHPLLQLFLNDSASTRQQQAQIMRLKDGDIPLLVVALQSNPEVFKALIALNNTLDSMDSVYNLRQSGGKTSAYYNGEFLLSLTTRLAPDALPEVLRALVTMNGINRADQYRQVQNKDTAQALREAISKNKTSQMDHDFIKFTSELWDVSPALRQQLTELYAHIQTPNLPSYLEAKLRNDWLAVTQALQDELQKKLGTSKKYQETYHPEKQYDTASDVIRLNDMRSLSNLMTIHDSDTLEKMVPLTPPEQTPAVIAQAALTDPDAWQEPMTTDWVMSCFTMLGRLDNDDQIRLLSLKVQGDKTIAQCLSDSFNQSEHWHALLDRLTAEETRQSTFHTLTTIWSCLEMGLCKEAIKDFFNRQDKRDESRAEEILTSPDFWRMIGGLLDDKEASPGVLESFMVSAETLIDHVKSEDLSFIPDDVMLKIDQYRADYALYTLLKVIQNETRDKADWDNVALIKRVRQPIAPPDTPNIEQLASLMMEALSKTNPPASLLNMASHESAVLSETIVALLGQLTKSDLEKFLKKYDELVSILARKQPKACRDLLRIASEAPNMAGILGARGWRANDALHTALFSQPHDDALTTDIIDYIKKLTIEDKTWLLSKVSREISSDDNTHYEHCNALMLAMKHAPQHAPALSEIIKTLPPSTQVKILTQKKWSDTVFRMAPKEQLLNLFSIVEALPDEKDKVAILLSAEHNLYSFATYPESLPALFVFINKLTKLENKSAILTSPMFMSYLCQQTSPWAKQMTAELFTMIRELPLEDQAKQVKRCEEYSGKSDGTIGYPISFNGFQNTQPAPAVLLDYYLIMLAHQVDEFKKKAALAAKDKKPVDLTRYALARENALNFYTTCDALSRRNYFDAKAWGDAIATANTAFSHDKIMLDVIKNIDLNQRARENPRMEQAYKKWAIDSSADVTQDMIDELEDTFEMPTQVHSSSLAKIRASSIANQVKFLQFITKNSSYLSAYSSLMGNDPIAKRDFHLIELAGKVDEFDQKNKHWANNSQVLMAHAVKHKNEIKLAQTQQQDYAKAYETARTLHKQLNRLADEQTEALSQQPLKPARLSGIAELWDEVIEQAKPTFKPHHGMQSLLNQLVRAAKGIVAYFSKAPSKTELLDELKASKPPISVAVSRVSTGLGFFRPVPVKYTFPGAGNANLFVAIRDGQPIIEPPTREALIFMPSSSKSGWTRDKDNALTLAIKTNRFDALLLIVPAMMVLSQHDQGDLLRQCTDHQLSLLSDKIQTAFNKNPEAIRGLFYLELERIIMAVEVKAPKSRLLKTMTTLKQAIANNESGAVLKAQETLKKEMSWSTWLGVSSTATLRRETDRLLHAMLASTYETNPDGGVGGPSRR